MVDLSNYLEVIYITLLSLFLLPPGPRITINQFQLISKYLLIAFSQTLWNKEVYSLALTTKGFVVSLEEASRAGRTEQAIQRVYLVWTMSTVGVQRRGRSVGARKERVGFPEGPGGG